MQIVIDIPDNFYKVIANDKYGVHKGRIYNIIRDGTPLPKGHGKLIDADVFQQYCFNKNFDKRLSDFGLAIINMFLEFQPIIIEADKEESEE